MNKNPYESPPPEDATPRARIPARFTRAELVYFPLAWGVIMFIGLVRYGSTGQINPDVPVAMKVVSTIVTAAALVVLMITIRGWNRLLTIPLAVYLVWIQYLVWTFYANR